MITITSLWIAAMVLLLFLARSVRTVHRALRCPLRGTHAQVSFLVALPEGRPIDVIACSEFRPKTAITCDRSCRPLLGRRAIRPAGRLESETGLVTGASEGALPAVESRSA